MERRDLLLRASTAGKYIVIVKLRRNLLSRHKFLEIYNQLSDDHWRKAQSTYSRHSADLCCQYHDKQPIWGISTKILNSHPSSQDLLQTPSSTLASRITRKSLQLRNTHITNDTASATRNRTRPTPSTTVLAFHSNPAGHNGHVYRPHPRP